MVKSPFIQVENLILEDGMLYNEKYNKDKKIYELHEIGRGVWIDKVTQSLETQEVTYLLKYNFNGQICERNISGKYLEEKELKKLVKIGVDVPDYKIRSVAVFLNKQASQVPVEYTHNQLGWSTFNDQLVYKHHHLIGHNISSTYQGDLVVCPHGSLDGWKELIQKEVLGTTPLELAMIFGLSSPIIGMVGEELDVDTLMFHIYGDATKGKTTAARLAVSSFGKPSTKNGGLIHTWNGTQNALIGRVAGNRGLPVVFDEANMNRMKNFTSMIYQLAGGTEKDRMNKEAELRERKSWSTSLISTAEHSLTVKSNQNTGLMMRNFEFGNITWTRDASNADRLNEGLLKNYGHAGIKFVEYLLRIGKEEVLKRWRDWSNQCYKKMDVKDNYSNRVANKHAFIMVTVELASEALELDLNLEAIQNLLVEQDRETMENRDIGKKAINFLKEKIIQHRTKFVGEYFHETGYECWGKITNNGQFKEVNILKSSLEELLKEGKFEDVSVVLKNWKDKGYLVHESDKLTKRKRIPELDEVDDVKKDGAGRTTTYCIRFNKEDLELEPSKSITSRPRTS